MSGRSFTGTDEAFGPREHLACGAAREGEEEDALGDDSPLDQGGDAMDERARLPRAGAGDDEQRTVAEGGGPGLVGIQRRGELRVGDGVIARARPVKAGPVIHAANIGVGPNGCRKRTADGKRLPDDCRGAEENHSANVRALSAWFRVGAVDSLAPRRAVKPSP